MPARESPGANPRALTIVAFSATAGAFVEFYDFFIYGYAAASAFPAIFFPKLPPAQALVLSYLAFVRGFQRVSSERSSLATSAIAWGESFPSCSTLRSSESPHA